MNESNRGIILEDRKAGDYVYGGFSLAPKPRTILNWTPYLPDGEWQRTNMTDFMDCVTFSAIHCIETQVNLDISLGKYKQEALDYFQSAGYMENGKFRASVRYNATMNGTTTSGQYTSVAADGLRHHGLLPNKDLPMLPNMTWAEYYAPISPDLIAKAKKIYDYMDISYQWVDAYNMPDSLLNAPVQIATAVCDGWNTDSPIKACGGPCVHVTMVYGEDSNQNYLDFDHYVPFNKKLASNYHIFSAMQFVVASKLPPNMWNTFINLLKSFNVR